MIRKATLADINEVRELVMMASDLAFEDALGTKDRKQVDELFDLYYKSKDTRFSVDNTIVYEVDGEVAGCLVYYPSANEKMYNENMLKLLNRNYEFSIEGTPNSIYLDSIAVFDRYRGLGISRKMIEYVIKNTNQDLSLLVEIVKENVQAYYERLGFTTVRRLDIFGSVLDLMVYKK